LINVVIKSVTVVTVNSQYLGTGVGDLAQREHRSLPQESCGG